MQKGQCKKLITEEDHNDSIQLTRIIAAVNESADIKISPQVYEKNKCFKEETKTKVDQGKSKRTRKKGAKILSKSSMEAEKSLQSYSFHIIVLGVFLILIGIVMSTLGFYISKSKEINTVLAQYTHWLSHNQTQNTDDKNMNLTFEPYDILNSTASNPIGSNDDFDDAATHDSETVNLSLTLMSYVGPCFMGIGCIIIVIFYVIIFEARDRSTKIFPAFLTKARTKAIYDTLIQDTKCAVDKGSASSKMTPEANFKGASPYLAAANILSAPIITINGANTTGLNQSYKNRYEIVNQDNSLNNSQVIGVGGDKIYKCYYSTRNETIRTFPNKVDREHLLKGHPFNQSSQNKKQTLSGSSFKATEALIKGIHTKVLAPGSFIKLSSDNEAIFSVSRPALNQRSMTPTPNDRQSNLLAANKFTNNTDSPSKLLASSSSIDFMDGSEVEK